MRCYLLSLLVGIVFVAGCGRTTIEPYEPPADVRGVLTDEIIHYGKYFIPIEESQAEQVSSVMVRWTVGTYTHPDGTVERIWTFWQHVAYEVGKSYVTVPELSVSKSANEIQYWIKLDE